MWVYVLLSIWSELSGLESIQYIILESIQYIILESIQYIILESIQYIILESIQYIILDVNTFTPLAHTVSIYMTAVCELRY